MTGRFKTFSWGDGTFVITIVDENGDERTYVSGQIEFDDELVAINVGGARYVHQISQVVEIQYTGSQNLN